MQMQLDKNDSFDRTLALSTDGDTIILAPGGSYDTYGAWVSESGNINVPSGVSIVATDATIELKAPTGISRVDHDLPILRCGSEVKIQGGTWRCNYNKNPGWYCQGIRFHGRYEIRDATIVGMSGSRASKTASGAVESFAISSEGATGGSVVSGVTVDQCKMDGPDDYVSGIYIGCTVPNLVESCVTDCTVNLGQWGQFAYASSESTRFVNCAGTAARFFYVDTGPSVNTKIINCRGAASYAAISLVNVPNVVVRREVVINGGTFTAPRFVEWWDQTPLPNMIGAVIAARAAFAGEWGATVDAVGGLVVLVELQLTQKVKVLVSARSQHPVIIE